MVSLECSEKRNTGVVGALGFNLVGWQYDVRYRKDLYPRKYVGMPVPCEFQFSIFFFSYFCRLAPLCGKLLLFLHALLPSSVLRVLHYFSLSVSMEMETRCSEVEHLSTLT